MCMEPKKSAVYAAFIELIFGSQSPKIFLKILIFCEHGISAGLQASHG